MLDNGQIGRLYLEEEFVKELEDILDNLHVCDDEGRGCENEDHYIDGQRYTRCRLKNQNVEALQSLITQAERRGEVSQLKLLRGWANLHQLGVLPSDFDHVLRSLEQFPYQPLASQTLAELEKRGKDGE